MNRSCENFTSAIILRSPSVTKQAISIMWHVLTSSPGNNKQINLIILINQTNGYIILYYKNNYLLRAMVFWPNLKQIPRCENYSCHGNPYNKITSSSKLKYNGRKIARWSSWRILWTQRKFELTLSAPNTTNDMLVNSPNWVSYFLYINPSSLKPFGQTYSLNGGFVGSLPKIFVMRGPINLQFGMNVNWTSSFHLMLITWQIFCYHGYQTL